MGVVDTISWLLAHVHIQTHPSVLISSCDAVRQISNTYQSIFSLKYWQISIENYFNLIVLYEIDYKQELWNPQIGYFTQINLTKENQYWSSMSYRNCLI